MRFEEKDDDPSGETRGRNNAVFIMLKSPKGQADRLGGSFLGEPFCRRSVLISTIAYIPTWDK